MNKPRFPPRKVAPVDAKKVAEDTHRRFPKIMAALHQSETPAMSEAALNRVFSRLAEAEKHILTARRIIAGLLMDTPFDFEHQADEFLKATEEYEDE